MSITPWFEQMKNSYNAAISNFFIFSGNVFDYAVPGKLFYDYLKENLKKEMGFSQILTLNPSYNSLSGEVDNHTEAMKPLLSNIQGKPKTAVIVKFPEFIYPNNEEAFNHTIDPRFFYTLYDILTHKNFISSQNLLIFITESKYAINPRLYSGSTRSTYIEITFPDEKERLSMIEFVQKGLKPIRSEVTKEVLARITVGLTRLGIEDIILQAQFVGELKKKFILDRKEELIKREYGELLEIMSVDKYSFRDFSGGEHLKKYHLDAIIRPMKRGDKRIVPKGLLYTGPPGTGKTHFARCLAGETGINFVELKMSNILDKYLGESEKKFDKAISCIKSIAPVGVFIDELDQTFRRGNENGPIAEGRIFSMFLSILSDPETRGQILWIAATNYPNEIDEALKRPGRFDKKIPFLLPQKEDIQLIVELYVKKSELKTNLTPEDFERISDELQGFTQAEIENVVIKATELTIRGQGEELNVETICQAISYSKRVSNEKVRGMIDLAIDECNDLELLPTAYSDRWQRNKYLLDSEEIKEPEKMEEEVEIPIKRIGFKID